MRKIYDQEAKTEAEDLAMVLAVNITNNWLGQATSDERIRERLLFLLRPEWTDGLVFSVLSDIQNYKNRRGI